MDFGTINRPGGKNFTITQMVKGCEINICGNIYRAELLLLNMQDFKLILGMDWLSQHRAVLDYFEKKITLRVSSIPISLGGINQKSQLT